MTNSIPTLTGLTATAFSESAANQTPQLLAPDLTFLDADGDFSLGALTVSGLLAEDVVSIRNQGAGAGQIGFANGIITYGGTAIGFAAGGIGSTLHISFLPGATPAAIDALLENLTYANTSNAPTASRTLEISSADATGAAAQAPLAFTERTGTANPFDGVGIGYISRAILVDIDGDGDLDAMVGGQDGTLNYLQNIGTASAPIFTAAVENPFGLPLVGSLIAPSFADLDGDGDLDAIVGNFDGTLYYLHNTGTATAPAFSVAPSNPFALTDVGSRSTPTFADLDGDGDLDALVGGNDGNLNYLENTGSATAPVFAAAVVNPFGFSDQGANVAPSFADLDGDGDLDAVIGTGGGLQRYFENVGSAAAPAFVRRTGAADPFDGFTVGFDNVPSFVDINADGDLDAVVGEYDGVLNYLENTTPAPTSRKFVAVTGSADPFAGIDVGDASAADFADLDGDGDLDALTRSSSGIVEYFENVGSAIAPSFVLRTGGSNPVSGYNNDYLAGSGNGTPSFADLDGDGAFDLFVGQFVFYFPNEGSATIANFGLSTGGPLGAFTAAIYKAPGFVDLDGDGDTDVVFGADDGTLRYLENTGTATAPSFVTGASNPFDGIDVGSNSVPDFADIDRDGDFDLLVGESGGTLRYFENTGTATAPIFAERTGSANPFGGIDVGSDSTPSFADIDGDGDADLVVGSGDGTLTYFRNIAAGFSVSVTVTADDDIAVAIDDTFAITETATITGNVFASNGSGADSDADSALAVMALNGSAASVGTEVVLPSGALLTLNTDGTFTYDPNAAFDVAPVGSGAPNLTATDSFTYTLAGGATATVVLTITGVDAADALTGTEAVDLLWGLDFNDQLLGLGGNDQLSGDAGNDTLDGGAGVDLLDGGAGDDTYLMIDGTDFIIDAAGTDIITSTISRSLRGFSTIENLTLLGTAASGTGNSLGNIITGNASANTLAGAAGNDQLFGGAGRDQLTGGAGKDLLTGGTGKDQFDFNAISQTGKSAVTRDIITDFVHGTDKIDLATIDANGRAANNGRFNLVTAEGAAFTGVRGQLIWDRKDNSGSANDKTIVSGDINGDRVADFSIELTGLKALTAVDFVL